MLLKTANSYKFWIFSCTWLYMIGADWVLQDRRSLLGIWRTWCYAWHCHHGKGGWKIQTRNKLENNKKLQTINNLFTNHYRITVPGFFIFKLLIKLSFSSSLNVCKKKILYNIHLCSKLPCLKKLPQLKVGKLLFRALAMDSLWLQWWQQQRLPTVWARYS